jgi:hypothetical protein
MPRNGNAKELEDTLMRATLHHGAPNTYYGQ